MIKQKETKQPAAKAPVSSGTGRRKSSVARVWLRRGKGKMTINGLPVDQYLDTDVSRSAATIPFRVVKEASGYDVEVNVKGGGKVAQADAIKLGFARALVAVYDNLRPVLREHDLLSVDSRLKERKKYGQRGARRKFQFVKR